jgi:hypothetical protein
MNKIKKYYYNILKKTEYKDVNYDRLIMRGGYEFPNATDAELEDALDWAGSKVYYKKGFLAKELLKIAKSLISYKGGPIRTDRNFVKDIATKIEWVMEDQDKLYDIGGSLYGDEDGLLIEEVGDVAVKIPLKDLYRYVDIPMKEFGYRLKSDLNKIVKEVNKDGLSLWVVLHEADFKGFIHNIKVANAKIRGSDLLLKMDDYSIEDGINYIADEIESHLEDMQY